jgi:hypothetical protein
LSGARAAFGKHLPSASRLTSVSSRERSLGCVRWHQVEPAHHAEPVEQTDRAAEDRDEQRDLQGERSCVGVMRMISSWRSAD